MGRVLNAALAEHVSLERRMPARCTAVAFDDDGVVLHTEPGERPLRARLVVAADGANSLVRAAAGLEANVEDYQQVAIVAHVASSRPADGTAYERFTPSGPFAVLPLQDGHYGIVWTLSPAAAEEILALSDADYLARLQVAFGWRIGRLLRVGRRQAYPLRLTRAAAVTAERCVLIGNAAQALHPVAGQGFNLGLRDAVTLAELLADARRDQRGVDVGSAALLAEFARRRSADREGIIDFTDRLVKLFGDQRPGVPLLRDIGLLLFDLSPTAKQAMSRLSWGFAGRTPRLARGLSL
jgi:2-octaprenyl-6-methoxyphenol hydroxylase